MVSVISGKSVSSETFVQIEEINWSLADRRNSPAWAARRNWKLNVASDSDTCSPELDNSANILAAEPRAAADFRDPLSRECAESSEEREEPCAAPCRSTPSGEAGNRDTMNSGDKKGFQCAPGVNRYCSRQNPHLSARIPPGYWVDNWNSSLSWGTTLLPCKCYGIVIAK